MFKVMTAQTHEKGANRFAASMNFENIALQMPFVKKRKSAYKTNYLDISPKRSFMTGTSVLNIRKKCLVKQDFHTPLFRPRDENLQVRYATFCIYFSKSKSIPMIIIGA